jgi:LuxR family transcriptional regulator, quorum-sensing system regulator CinR
MANYDRMPNCGPAQLGARACPWCQIVTFWGNGSRQLLTNYQMNTDPDFQFDELYEAVSAESDLERALKYSCGQLGINHMVYHLAHNRSLPMDSPFVRTTYSPNWVARYLLNNYVEVDPVVLRGFESALPFFWSDLTFDKPIQKLLFEEAISQGVGELGYSVPITDKLGRRALFSVNHKGDEMEWRRKIFEIRPCLVQLSQLLHRKALRLLHATEVRPPLSPREIECLQWIARGKDAPTVSEILEISEHTVRDYLRSAKNKLGCGTLAQAIYEASKMRLINL